ncbi:hypothetical protein [Paraburkholderia dipogonis]|uniref:hypothetical protein n=1 Tax=Paraburkholderia dipogonis TaxID=1211383 RepID=UPI0038B8EFB5
MNTLTVKDINDCVPMDSEAMAKVSGGAGRKTVNEAIADTIRLLNGIRDGSTTVGDHGGITVEHGPD